MESELETGATGATYLAIFSGICHIPFGDRSNTVASVFSLLPFLTCSISSMFPY